MPEGKWMKPYRGNTVNLNSIREALLNTPLTWAKLIQVTGRPQAHIKRAMDGLLANGEVISNDGIYEITDKGRAEHAKKNKQIKNVVPDGRTYLQLHEVNQTIRKILPGTPVPQILKTIRENDIKATSLGDRKMYSVEQVQTIFELVNNSQ